MKIKLTALAVVGLLVQGCTNPHTGQIDPTSTTLAVGAGLLAVGALGYTAGQNSVPARTHHHHHYRPHHFAAPPRTAYRRYYGPGYFP